MSAPKSDFETLKNQADQEKVTQAVRKLRTGTDTDALIRGGRTAATHGTNRLALWLISEELTRRGVSPAFRQLPSVDHPNDHQAIVDAVWIDLDWVCRSPNYRPRDRRLRRLFDESGFAAFARHAAGATRLQPWQRCKDLGLDEPTQQELRFLKLERIASRLRRLLDLEAAASIRIGARTKRLKNESGGLDRMGVIARRVKLLTCAQLSDWSPTRSAFLYQCMTGQPMTRQVAAKVLEDLKVMFPEFSPKRRRSARRPRKTPGYVSPRKDGG